jgi:hypothetical protein
MIILLDIEKLMSGPELGLVSALVNPSLSEHKKP